MKAVLLLILALSVYAEAAETVKTFSMESDRDFRATFVRDFKSVSYRPGGVTGRAFNVSVPADHPKGFTVHSCEKQKTDHPVEITISGMFKGKGKFSIGFIVYDRNHKIYWITKAPGAASELFEIDSMDQWVFKTFTFRPSEENVKKITGFLASVSIRPGSELLMDDIKTVIKQ